MKSATEVHEITELIADARAGISISPTRFAVVLEQELSEFERCANVAPNTARFHPDAEPIQSYLRASLLVIDALLQMNLEVSSALFCFRNFPLKHFSYKTPEMVVSDGHAVDLLLRL